MRRYRFRLEQVLRVRRLQEELARNDVLTARREAQAAAEAVRRRVEAVQQHGLPAGPVTSDELVGHHVRHQWKADAVVIAAHQCAEADQNVQARVQDWTRAAQRVQGLARLDERGRAEHAVDSQREADREVDDVVVGRFRLQEARR